jgi:alkanesulfonate monooxygenase SsuD/methylene tetrahydromethanopterin reductase-like flavin-dependent oxidoreductase (luciferase family)
LLTDALAALKVLWRDTPADFDSPTLSFRELYCEPKPLQQGGVPLWVAGTLNRRNLERVVQHGDGWIPIMGATLDDIAAGARTIREAWSTTAAPTSRAAWSPFPRSSAPA